MVRPLPRAGAARTPRRADGLRRPRRPVHRFVPRPDAARHFGLVVDDKAAVRRALEEAGVELTPAPNCSFLDPWGNQVQVVDYREIQFTKAENVARGMGIDGLEKTDVAQAELREKGLL